MSRRVLVTGAGGAAAVAFIQAVEAPRTTLLAADLDPNAAGLYLVPPGQRFLLPRGDDPAFVDALLTLCRNEGVDVLVPTVDVELLPVARAAAAFEAAGVALLLAPQDALRTCLDKAALVEACEGVVPVPRTAVLDASVDPASWTHPCIVKPRAGAGGRGFRVLHDIRAWEGLPRDGSLIVQQHLPGEEYSVDVLVDPSSGEVRAAVPRLRMKVDSGVAVTARTVRDAQLQALSEVVARHVGLTHVANVQWRRDADGLPRLLEINARFPGTMPLTVAAGIDMPNLALDAACGTPIPPQPLFREVAIVRTWTEHRVPVADLGAVPRARAAEAAA